MCFFLPCEFCGIAEKDRKKKKKHNKPRRKTCPSGLRPPSLSEWFLEKFFHIGEILIPYSLTQDMAFSSKSFLLLDVLTVCIRLFLKSIVIPAFVW